MTTMTDVIPWDATDYLKTDEDIAGYLTVVFETGDIGDITHSLSTVARARGMSGTAKDAGLAQAPLYKAIGEGANLTLSTFMSALDALNISLSAVPKLAIVAD